MSAIQFRPYQQESVDRIRESFRSGKRAPLLVSPTGSGKTCIFSGITEGAAAKGNRVLILVHRAELLDQTTRALTALGVPHGCVAAGRTPNPRELVQVASVQTLVRRLDIVKCPDLIVLDECHHAAAGSWLKVLKHYNSRILGVTATPERLDGKGLGNVFDDLIRGPEVADLIEQGYLCKPVYYAPGNVDLSGVRTTAGDYNKGDLKKALDKPKIVGSAIEHYTRICPGVPAIAFCCSIELAERTAAEFNAAGYRFAVIDGTLQPAARKELVRKLGTGELHGLASCDIVSEGFDLPVVTAAILLRPTQSLSLHLQQIGRVLRPHPTKTHAIIIDHVGNVGSKQGSNWIPKHGLAEERREWTLEGTTSKRKKQLGADVRNRQCPECYGVHGIAPICPLCGHEYVIAERRPEEIEGDLTELSPEAMAAASMARKVEQGRAKTLPELIALGKSRGFKNPAAWAGHVLRSRGMKGAAA